MRRACRRTECRSAARHRRGDVDEAPPNAEPPAPICVTNQLVLVTAEHREPGLAVAVAVDDTPHHHRLRRVPVEVDDRAGDEVERGQVLCKPGTITPHTHFESEVYILSKEEGGRHTPFFSNYRPQFYFRTTDVTGAVELPEGTEMVMPGDNIKMTVKLIVPIAMEEGLRFAIREGGRTVGAGVVAKIIE